MEIIETWESLLGAHLGLELELQGDRVVYLREDFANLVAVRVTGSAKRGHKPEWCRNKDPTPSSPAEQEQAKAAGEKKKKKNNKKKAKNMDLLDKKLGE